MSTLKQKDRFMVRFELSLLGMCSLTLVTGCIFFWMFIIGIWAGQTILQPNSGEGKSTLPTVAETVQPGVVVGEPGDLVGEKKNMLSEPAAASEAEWAESEPSFFALQVAAVSEQDRAQQEVAQWRVRGYDAFSLPPEDKGDPFIRVYVGRFDKQAEANQLVAQLEKEANLKANVVLLPVARLKAP
ncbi:MAG TPA: hypothetical protein DEQ20_08975 [Desulfobulbaceae bacterium]|nr:hypothetical protein [Desulfobulbaceae bacterium]